MRVKRWCDDLGAHLDVIIDLGLRFDFDFRLMRKFALAMARVVAAEDEGANLRQEWS